MKEVPAEFMTMVEADIKRINDCLSSASQENQWELFREIDGRYQACVKDWYVGMWESSHEGNVLWFNRLQKQPHEITENLKYARSKLETFRFQMNAILIPEAPSTSVNVTTNVSFHISFEEARQKIEDMTALNQEQTDEVTEKIDELEAISKEDISRKKKWEKVRPILLFALDKGADIATAIMALVLQMKLGL